MAEREPFACVARAWSRHERELRAFLRHRLQDADAADDLLQEVFIKAMRQGRAFCHLDNPRAWLFEVARHGVIDAARVAKPHTELTRTLAESLPAPSSERAPVDELDACIERNLPRLDEQDRDIITACDLAGQTVRAYAEAHALSLAAAKSRLFRARKRLREQLIEHCGVRFDEAGRVCCHAPG
ncbi:MAG: sigma-70 family RNA polymerase sigma factor, partial [Casimicrobiaceae bacterium]